MLVVLGIIVLLIAVILFNTFSNKPTCAKDAKVVLNESERASEYGKRLSQMVQKETISCKNQEDRTKFYEFHEILEEMFPHIHQTCEKNVFDGSLLFKWP